MLGCSVGDTVGGGVGVGNGVGGGGVGGLHTCTLPPSHPSTLTPPSQILGLPHAVLVIIEGVFASLADYDEFKEAAQSSGAHTHVIEIECPSMVSRVFQSACMCVRASVYVCACLLFVSACKKGRGVILSCTNEPTS